jgi:RND family efflux transporter MFP subunit
MVETAPVVIAPLEQTVRLTGDILAGESVRLFGQIPDRLTEVLVDVGDHVRRGQVLARIRDEGLKAGVEQIEANLRAAQSSLANLKDELARTESLYAVGAVSSQTLEGVQTQTETAEAQVEQFQAALIQVQSSYQNALITAPFAGLIAERYLQAGDLVGPGLPVFRLVNMDHVTARSDVSQERVGQMRIGLAARVTVSSYPGTVFHGDVVRITPVLDPMTRMSTVEVGIDNQDGRLKAGMFAEIHLVVQSLEGELTIPLDALLEEYRYVSRSPMAVAEAFSEDSGSVEARVFVAGADSIAQLTTIRVGIVKSDLVQVLEGLDAGQVVVTVGKYRLQDGDRIEIAAPGSGQPEGGR